MAIPPRPRMYWRGLWFRSPASGPPVAGLSLLCGLKSDIVTCPKCANKRHASCGVPQRVAPRGGVFLSRSGVLVGHEYREPQSTGLGAPRGRPRSFLQFLTGAPLAERTWNKPSPFPRELKNQFQIVELAGKWNSLDPRLEQLPSGASTYP